MIDSDYDDLLRSAFSVATHPRPELPLHVIATKIAGIVRALPFECGLGTNLESADEWAHLYLELDLLLFRASQIMLMPIFLIDREIREQERIRVIRELDALGMFS